MRFLCRTLIEEATADNLISKEPVYAFSLVALHSGSPGT